MNHRPRGLTHAALGILTAIAVLAMPGCIIPAAIGGMAESYQRTGKTKVEAEYTGLTDNSFAVVATASRMMESEHPGLTARLIQRINERLAVNAGASHFIPSNDLLTVLYNTPHWPAMTRGEVGEMLGVERLVVIEVIDYTLHEPGNQYIWEGVASVLVSVFETDSPLPDDPIFEKAIRVTFPDTSGFMRTDIPEAAVTSELSNRVVNRVSWLFYDHEEANIIPY